MTHFNGNGYDQLLGGAVLVDLLPDCRTVHVRWCRARSSAAHFVAR